MKAERVTGAARLSGRLDDRFQNSNHMERPNNTAIFCTLGHPQMISFMESLV
jgi:hypothetical protein